MSQNILRNFERLRNEIAQLNEYIRVSFLSVILLSKNCFYFQKLLNLILNNCLNPYRGGCAKLRYFAVVCRS